MQKFKYSNLAPLENFHSMGLFICVISLSPLSGIQNVKLHFKNRPFSVGIYALNRKGVQNANQIGARDAEKCSFLLSLEKFYDFDHSLVTLPSHKTQQPSLFRENTIRDHSKMKRVPKFQGKRILRKIWDFEEVRIFTERSNFKNRENDIFH